MRDGVRGSYVQSFSDTRSEELDRTAIAVSPSSPEGAHHDQSDDPKLIMNQEDQEQSGRYGHHTQPFVHSVDHFYTVEWNQ